MRCGRGVEKGGSKLGRGRGGSATLVVFAVLAVFAMLLAVFAMMLLVFAMMEA